VLLLQKFATKKTEGDLGLGLVRVIY